jgi:flavin reductase (DIM6/NTAB) family NADH-FMN oxidoreductase RutF
MAKAKGNAAQAATATVQAATVQAAPQLLTLGKPYNPKANTKNGAGGCAGTWAAVVAHLNAHGPSTLAALKAVAAANGDPPFIGYCIGQGRLTYVKPAAPAQP